LTTPSQADLKKREDKLKQFLKKLDEDGKPNEHHVLNVVRSAIRQAWMKSDTKLAYLYMNTIPDMDDSTRTKWLFKCEMCGELFKLNEIEIDHKKGHNKFTSTEDFVEYFQNILMVGFDDLQILCKTDHAVKSLSESFGISFEEAKLEKQVIEICKSKKDKQFIKDAGLNPASNSTLRRLQVKEILEKYEKDC
jgi:hypothetical protein